MIWRRIVWHVMLRRRVRWRTVAFQILLTAHARCRLGDQQRVLRRLGHLFHSVMWKDTEKTGLRCPWASLSLFWEYLSRFIYYCIKLSVILITFIVIIIITTATSNSSRGVSLYFCSALMIFMVSPSFPWSSYVSLSVGMYLYTNLRKNISFLFSRMTLFTHNYLISILYIIFLFYCSVFLCCHMPFCSWPEYFIYSLSVLFFHAVLIIPEFLPPPPPKKKL
jgi:hypothetical protein